MTMPGPRPALQSTAQAACIPNDYYRSWQYYYGQWQYYYYGSWPWHDRQQPLGHGTLPAHVRQSNHAWPGAQSSHTQPLPSARHTARPLTTDDASYSSGYEYSESESEESSASQKTMRRADMTTTLIQRIQIRQASLERARPVICH